jgi:AcrR family transcriptional regulator
VSTSQERRQREKEEMRQAICRAAMKIFLTEGFERASLRRIADEISYTPGAIYSYFEGKDEILFTLHTQGFDRLRARLEAIPHGTPPFERLRDMGREYLRFALTNPEYYDLMFIMEATVDPATRDERWRSGFETYDLLRQQVRLCQAEGSLPAHPLEAATFALWAMVHGIASLVVKKRATLLLEGDLWTQIESAYEFGLMGMRAAQTR